MNGSFPEPHDPEYKALVHRNMPKGLTEPQTDPAIAAVYGALAGSAIAVAGQTIYFYVLGLIIPAVVYYFAKGRQKSYWRAYEFAAQQVEAERTEAAKAKMLP